MQPFGLRHWVWSAKDGEWRWENKSDTPDFIAISEFGQTEQVRRSTADTCSTHLLFGHMSARGQKISCWALCSLLWVWSVGKGAFSRAYFPLCRTKEGCLQRDFINLSRFLARNLLVWLLRSTPMSLSGSDAEFVHTTIHSRGHFLYLFSVACYQKSTSPSTSLQNWT